MKPTVWVLGDQLNRAGNHRMTRQLGGMRRLGDLDAVRDRATEVLAALDAGRL